MVIPGIESPQIKDKQSNQELVLFRGCTPIYKTPEISESAETILKRKQYKLQAYQMKPAVATYYST